MSEGNKIAAALLACEASRQQQELVKAGPGRPLAAREVDAELWAYFEGFLERLERATRPGRLIAGAAGISGPID